MHYLKYLLFHSLTFAAVAGILLGGPYMWLGLVAALSFVVVGDLLLGDDTSTPELKHKWLLNLQLYSALVLVSVLTFCMVWMSAPNYMDALGFGEWMQSVTGHDIFAARSGSGVLDYLGGALSTILFIGLVGTIVGHELTHRTWDPVSMFIGRWLLAFSWDTGFAIEHVYGHHKYVSTLDDPATAPRGRSVYSHVVISTIEGNVSAWKIEKNRLQKLNKALFGFSNKYLRGLAMTALLTLAAYGIAQWQGVLMFTICALGAKALLEIVNYMEHYGLVRNPQATPCMPRHSWNSNTKISSWATFNLTRHSHHHAHGELPFWDLKPYEDAPMMVSGYLSTMLLTLVPPLWHRLMAPKLKHWDEHYASAEERFLAQLANQKSNNELFVSSTNQAA
ncbi:alkane 1-monooxygenase [Gammaproteobacteria bacterium 42_54_T18]|nr:alkane 1-monooxygenase [Gammaproteobacteria bacterium 42_54_T18]